MDTDRRARGGPERKGHFIMSKQRTHGAIRRLMAGLLCLALTLGLLPSGLVLPARAAHWADAYGQKLVEWGVMRGDISGNLNLDRPITRAELVTMINRAYGYTRKAGTPFTDVPSSKWYADDIDIAYNAGYFKGVSSTAASPEGSVTREQAAVFLARNLMLQETVGETLGFSDTRTLSEWSRGLIGAAVKEGVLNGYTDGSFQPKRNITRGEMAAMLVRAIGTPVNEAGNHTLGHVYGNVTLNTSNVTLRDTTIAGNLYLTGGIDLGHVLLENVTVLGKIIVSGAGESISGQESVVLRNVEAEELVLDNLRSPFVTIKAQGVTDIPLVTVRTDAYVDDSSWEGYGLARIELRGAPGAKLQLAGSIKEVMNFTPASDLQFVKGSAEKVTVDEDAIASKLLVDKNTRVDELNLDVGTTVSGEGDIGKLNVGSAGSVVEQLPDQIVIRPGIDADIDGETIGSSDAAELSAEPRLMAGYPFMKNIAPTEADGVFSASKPGTIYWAISAVADGSVSEEDLIENPAYGGNIFQEQAGSIAAGSAKTEYVEKVQELEPDGTYYVSAILVDGRGKHSPLKVMSFATPDDTKPAFVKDPTMTKITTDVAQTTVMANKDCLLYWALLPQGAQAPTPQEFKTGSLGGNYGYGSLNVVKNAEISVTVNRQKLREKTTYDLFLWLTDHNGAQSMDAPFKLTFTTPDETPPVVTDPQQIPPYAADSATVSFSMNEVGTLYWAVVPEGDTTFISIPDNATEDKIVEIMSDLRNKIRVESASDTTAGGSGATAAGKADAKTAFADVRFQITKLVTETTGTNNYRMWYIGKDAAGNYSDMVGFIDIKTLDTTPPSVEQKFTDEVNGQPRASTDIRLEFSETVKHGNEAGGDTFLSLYQAVQSAAGTSAETETKNKLADALASSIQLWSVPRNGTAAPVRVKGNGQTDDKWVIDFHNAQVKQENGKMVILLPNDTDLSKSALKLDSGATYYFQLLSVYDNAFIPNGILDPDTKLPHPNGNLKLPNFTTIYAQVNLEWNTRVSKITGATDAALNDTRLDIVVDVLPTSTAKVPKTECWDMIMWSDKTIEVQVYRLTLKRGTDEVETPWELLNPTKNAAINIAPDNPTPGIGLGTQVIVSDDLDAKYPSIKETLDEKYTYRYGFHIATIDGVKETDAKKEADSWSDLVTMHFGLIAGAQGQVRNASINVKGNFDDQYNITQNPRNITYISLAGTVEVLEASKQFLDTKAPSFGNNWPAFTAGSGTINMKVVLDRPGTVYYVAAPAGVIPTTLADGTSITTTTTSDTGVVTDGNDGTGTNGYNGVDVTKGKTYIPVNGADRSGHENKIYFLTGNDTAGAQDKRGIYAGPVYTDIMAGRFPGGNEVFIPTKPITYTNNEVSVDITGLQPKTVYYIYCVLQGGGTAADRVVQVYRQKTEDIQTPSINMSPTGTTGVTMTVNNVTIGGAATRYDNSRLFYALVEWNSLPPMFLKRYTWETGGGESTATSSTGNVMTVLEAMIKPYPNGGGATYFDKFGAETGIDLKDDVMEYISKVTGDVPGYVPIQRFPGNDQGVPDNPKAEDFAKDYMKSTTSEYVVLACARHRYSVDTGESYGFAAARGLYKPDMEPPEFIGQKDLMPASSPTAYAKATDTTPVLDWQLDKTVPLYYFDGTLSIRFDKIVYFYSWDTNGNRVRKEVWNARPSDIPQDKKDTVISILDVISGTGKSKMSISRSDSEPGATTVFTLQFNKLAMSDTIEMGELCNGDNQSPISEKTLVLEFDPTLRNSDYPNGYLDLMWQPGFHVTWQ